MLPTIFKKSLVLFLTVLLSFQFFVPIVKATVDSCTASVSPTSLSKNVTSNLTFTVNNTSSVSIIWVKFTSPSSNFTVTGGGGSGWQSLVSSTSNTFTSGTLSAGSSGTFTVSVQTVNSEVSSESWSVTASDDSGGAGAATCSGSTGVAITGDGTPPEITEVTVSDVSTGSVKINWTTDEATTGVISYGTTNAYGSTKSETSSATTHNTEITGLSANTTYHFDITATDASSNSSTWGDSTFTTAKSGTTTTTTTTVVTTATPTPTPKKEVDSISPSVVLLTDFTKPFKASPVISGRATDNKAVNSVEYSLDGGGSYTTVDKVNSPGSKSTNFEFLPTGLEDGNYKIKIRAKDSSGNIGISSVYTLVIDRLPPGVGGNLVSIGPQSLLPNSEGLIYTLVGLDTKITLSAVGGPLTINLMATKNGQLKARQLFALTKNPDNGLWSGVLSFTNPGVYQLSAKAIDGAGNKTERVLNTVLVLQNGRVSDGKTPAKYTTVTLFYFDNTTQRFIPWDGKAYGQENPQRTDLEGKYKLLVPPGKYYLQIQSANYKTLKTKIFNINKSMPLNSDFTLEEKNLFRIGPFLLPIPDFSYTQSSVVIAAPSVPDEAKKTNQAEGKSFPDFTLADLRGKPDVVTMLTSWSPYTPVQIPALQDLSSNKEIGVFVFLPQESTSSAAIFKKRGGYNLPIIADPDGVLVEPLNLQSIPTHYFLDRRGIIKKIKVGILTKEELLDNLIN